MTQWDILSTQEGISACNIYALGAVPPYPYTPDNIRASATTIPPLLLLNLTTTTNTINNSIINLTGQYTFTPMSSSVYPLSFVGIAILYDGTPSQIIDVEILGWPVSIQQSGDVYDFDLSIIIGQSYAAISGGS